MPPSDVKWMPAIVYHAQCHEVEEDSSFSTGRFVGYPATDEPGEGLKVRWYSVSLVLTVVLAINILGSEIGSTESTVTITVLADSPGEPFHNPAGGVNVLGTPSWSFLQDLEHFLDRVGSKLVRFKIWTLQVNPTLDNFLVINGRDHAPSLKAAVEAVHARGGEAMLQLYGRSSWPAWVVL